MRSHVAWGAIFSGAMVTLGAILLFTLFGSAIRLDWFVTALEATDGRGGAVGSSLYIFVSIILSFLLGGYVTGKLGWTLSKTHAALHGLSSWALIASLFTFVLGSGISSLAGGIFNLAGEGLQQTTSAPSPLRDTQDKRTAEKAKRLFDSSTMGEVPRNGIRPEREAAGAAARLPPNGVVWLSFASLLFGALASSVGSLLGSERPIPNAEGHPQRINDRRAA